MQKLSSKGLFKNKPLLIVIFISIMMAVVSIVFMSLNGVDRLSPTQADESNPKVSDDPVITLPAQDASYDDLSLPIDENPTALESTQAQEEAPPEPFHAIDEASCIPKDAQYQVALVIDVIDTDRLSVLMEGKTFTVKYLGIDTHSPDQEVSEQALTANHVLIGQTVTLVKDVSEADEEGSLLRYVFTNDAFINLYLLEKGLATTVSAPPDEACVEVFQAAQERARLQKIGTWEPLKPEDWRQWPVVPTISENALEIYRRGLEAGTNPKLFSIVGDCQSIPGGILFRKVNWEDFSLPAEYDYLQPTIEHFRSIWSRQPVTVDGGFIPASMFSTYWTDTDRCNPTETPLECEFHLSNSSILIISIGSDQKPGTEDDFDHYMRKIVEYSIENNVLPILTTDAYPTEEGFPLNYIMAQIAYGYDIPLWNFWAAIQDLPNHGLKEDNFHISAEAFAIKRITGVQVLHAVLTAAQQ